MIDSPLWTLAYNEALGRASQPRPVAFAEGVLWGVAWVLAIQGMAEAIKHTYMCWDCNCYVGLGKWQEGLAAICVCDCWRNDDHVCG